MNLYNDLKNSGLYIKKETAQQTNAAFCFKKELDVFNGHFPGNPILPGIFQIEMVKYTLEKSLDIRLRILSVNKTKFSNLIHPGEIIQINIVMATEETHQFKAKAILRAGDKIAGKINMVLAPR